MNEAPKKIWVEHEEGCWPAVLGEEHQGTGTPYIRADLVDGLVEALEHTAQLLEALGGTALMAKDALKALEETDGN